MTGKELAELILNSKYADCEIYVNCYETITFVVQGFYTVYIDEDKKEIVEVCTY